MPAFFHPNQHSTAMAQLIFDDMQEPPVQLVYENGDPVDEDDDDEDDEQNDNGPPALEPQDQDEEEVLPGMAVHIPEDPPLHMAAVAHQHHGNHHAAVMAQWFMAQHNHQQAAILNDFNIDLDNENPLVVPLEDAEAIELNLHALPQMHLYGVLPDDLMTLFHASSSQGSLGNGATMRTLKTRILSLRARKPQYWPRIALGLYKGTLRSSTGGCDARILVKPKHTGGPPAILWGHKFILASNPVFRQLFGYDALDDCLVDDGKVTDVDLPSITAEAMRTIIMATYDILPPKLSLEWAQYLEYWAVQFCLDDLLQLCQRIMKTAPWR